MRKSLSTTVRLLGLAGIAYLLGNAPALAVNKYTVSSATGHGLCSKAGGMRQGANGWEGCDIVGSGGHVYDVMCKHGSSKCTIIVVIHPNGGSKPHKPGPTRVGGVTTVQGGSGDDHGKPIRHPVHIGVANGPTQIKMPVGSGTIGKSGGSNHGGRGH